jgi:hypothetical protein
MRYSPLSAVATRVLGRGCRSAGQIGSMAIITKPPKSRLYPMGMPMTTAPMMQSQPENRETSVDRKDHRSNGWMEFGSIEMGVHAILRDKTNCPRVSNSTIPIGECSSLFQKSSRQRSSPKGPKNEISTWDRQKTMGLALFFRLRAWNSTIGICSENPFDRY